MRPVVFPNCTTNNKKNKTYVGAAKAALSEQDLRQQIQTLQKQVLKLTRQIVLMTKAASKNQKKGVKKKKMSKAQTAPAVSAAASSIPTGLKWHSTKRYRISRKNVPVSVVLAYAVSEGRYYLKLPKGQVCLLSKVTRLSYRGVTLTSHRTMRDVLSGKVELRLPEKKEGPKTTRKKEQSSGGKRPKLSSKAKESITAPPAKGTSGMRLPSVEMKVRITMLGKVVVEASKAYAPPYYGLVSNDRIYVVDTKGNFNWCVCSISSENLEWDNVIHDPLTVREIAGREILAYDDYLNLLGKKGGELA